MRFALVLSLVLVTTAPHATAQQSTATAYQQGAGAYFANRPEQAEKYLSEAIEESPQDPRAYYLRGLNRLATEDLEGARADLSKGAKLEAKMGSSSPLVDRSLSAVQGSARLTLERMRRSAREEAVVAERQLEQQSRRQAREQRERGVLRADFQLPMEALASRLTVEQARKVALREQPSQASAVAAGAKEVMPEGSDDNPFADDAQAGQPQASGGNREAVEVSVPEAARGSTTIRGLLGIFGGASKQAAANAFSPFESAIPAGGPMGEGPMEFEGDFPMDDAGGTVEGNPFGEGDPFMEDDASGSDDGGMEENPFDFGE